jgi:hypothetical protein
MRDLRKKGRERTEKRGNRENEKRVHYTRKYLS